MLGAIKRVLHLCYTTVGSICPDPNIRSCSQHTKIAIARQIPRTQRNRTSQSRQRKMQKMTPSHQVEENHFLRGTLNIQQIESGEGKKPRPKTRSMHTRRV